MSCAPPCPFRSYHGFDPYDRADRRGATVFRRAAASGAFCATVVATSALAQPPARVGETISATERAAVIDSVGRLLERLYVSPDTGRLIAAHLANRLRDNAYASTVTRADFAALVTRDLRAINADGHLALDPAPAARTAPAAAGAADAARRLNYNFDRVERLDGNVGYLKLNAFAGTPDGFRVAESALRFLAATDAVIIDLRNSRGGSGQMSNFLISHFTGPDTIRSLGIYRRAEGDTVYRWTMAQVPGPRRPDVPLYILVDGVTRSAAEDVAFVLHNLGRARVVGERTAGAGHNVGIIPVGAGLVVTMSVTRVFDPRTGREWERTGVPIDVGVPAAEALTTAHAEVLERLAAAEPDEARKEELRTVREGVLARARGLTIPERTLAAYVGNYGGGGLVTFAEGQLWQQTRRDQPRTALIPVSATRFILGGWRVEFVRDNANGVTMRLAQPGAGVASYTRLSPTVAPRSP